MAQFRHRLGLDLADPLARETVDLADLVERVLFAVVRPKRIGSRPLAFGECFED